MKHGFTKIDFHNSLEPQTGSFLLANTSLVDPNFFRAVVLLCEHEPEGTFGLVLTQPLTVMLSEGVQSLFGWDAPLHRGGPVEPGSLHFVHGRSDLDIGSVEVARGIYWGGSFERVNELIGEGVAAPTDFRFFVGYSGWGPGQLDEELEQQSWYLTPAASSLAFEGDPALIWQHALQGMGPEFAMLSHVPLDPHVN